MSVAFGPLVMGAYVSGDAWTGTEPRLAPENWTGSTYFAIANVPSNFVKMSGTTISLNGALVLQSYSNDTETLAITIVDASLNPLTNTVNYSNATSGITSGVSLLQSLTLTAAGIAGDATVWNGAQIEIVGSHDASMGSDGSYWSLYNLPSISGQMHIPPYVVLDTAEAADVWSATPDLLLTGYEGVDPDLRFDLQIAPSLDFDGPVQLTSNTNKLCYYYRGIYQGFKSPGGVINGFTIWGSRSATEYSGFLYSYLMGCNLGFDHVSMTPYGSLQQGTSMTWADLPASGNSLYIPLLTPYNSAKDEEIAIVLWASFQVGASGFNIAYNSNGTLTPGTGGIKQQLGATPQYIPDANGVSLKYQIDLSPLIIDASSFNNTDFDSASGEPYAPAEQVTYTIPDLTDFENLVSYYWRSRVIDPNGSNIQSDWTTPKSFVFKQTVTDLLLASAIINKLQAQDITGYVVYYGSINSDIVAAITLDDISAFTEYGMVLLTSPADGAPTQPIPVVLTWEALYYTEEYQIQIALDVDFTNIVINAYTQFNTYTFTTAEAVTEYFWRVKAVKKFRS